MKQFVCVAFISWIAAATSASSEQLDDAKAIFASQAEMTVCSTTFFPNRLDQSKIIDRFLNEERRYLAQYDIEYAEVLIQDGALTGRSQLDEQFLSLSNFIRQEAARDKVKAKSDCEATARTYGLSFDGFMFEPSSIDKVSLRKALFYQLRYPIIEKSCRPFLSPDDLTQARARIELWEGRSLMVTGQPLFEYVQDHMPQEDFVANLRDASDIFSATNIALNSELSSASDKENWCREKISN